MTIPETRLREDPKVAYYYTQAVHSLSCTLNIKIQFKYQPPGSEFVALQLASELIISLRYKL